MRAIHIIAGLSPSAGGPSYSVPRLCEALKPAGCETLLMSVADADAPPKPDVMSLPQDHAQVPGLSQLRISKALRGKLATAAGSAEIVHNHGLWLMPNVYAGRAAAHADRPLVVSPRGMLAAEALRFSPWKKKIFWRLLQGPALQHAAAWHATSLAEAAEIRAFGVAAPIAVIANGVDIPAITARHDAGAMRRTLVFLSRIHPKKGLPGLVEAWRRVAPQRPDWRLLIAGPDEIGHRKELAAQIARDHVDRAEISGPVYGADRDALLAAADLFVLPTRNENFGLAVAEALAAGVPAIVTKGAPWAVLQADRCGWWIDHGVEPLAAALLEATGLPSATREVMGRAGRAAMQRDFSWDAIGCQMRDAYFWLSHGGDRPATISVD